MKIILEEETGEGEDKTISKIKEISDIKEAKKGQFVHYCYHDDEHPRACRRVKK